MKSNKPTPSAPTVPRLRRQPSPGGMYLERVPVYFHSAKEYLSVWKPLVAQEARASISDSISTLARRTTDDDLCTPHIAPLGLTFELPGSFVAASTHAGGCKMWALRCKYNAPSSRRNDARHTLGDSARGDGRIERNIQRNPLSRGTVLVVSPCRYFIDRRKKKRQNASQTLMVAVVEMPQEAHAMTMNGAQLFMSTISSGSNFSPTLQNNQGKLLFMDMLFIKHRIMKICSTLRGTASSCVY